MANLTQVLNQIIGLKVSSQEMHNYINSLDKETYALLSTVYAIGRDGWEKTYVDTPECNRFIEEQEAQGVRVTNQMLDTKFLTKEIKKNQYNLTYGYELKDLIKEDGIYRHNWLSLKTNLVSSVKNGISLVNEI